MDAVPRQQAAAEAAAGSRRRHGRSGHRPHIIPRVKIYTKTGDAGETSLFDQTRVSKADSRVDAYGEVDEVNACLGAVRAAGVDADIAAPLEMIQKQLFALGARL